MAFKIENLLTVSNNKSTGAGIPSKFAFYNSASDTVTAAGFIPNVVGVREGDQVEVIDADYAGHIFYYAAVTAGVITLTVYA